MNTATQLTTKNNSWLTVGKATWVALWFLLALAVKASIILLTIVGKILGATLVGIFACGQDHDDPVQDKLHEQFEREWTGADDFEAYK